MGDHRNVPLSNVSSPWMAISSDLPTAVNSLCLMPEGINHSVLGDRVFLLQAHSDDIWHPDIAGDINRPGLLVYDSEECSHHSLVQKVLVVIPRTGPWVTNFHQSRILLYNTEAFHPATTVSSHLTFFLINLPSRSYAFVFESCNCKRECGMCVSCRHCLSAIPCLKR
jgi:hypothetical protein